MEAPSLALDDTFTVTGPTAQLNGHLVRRRADNEPFVAYEFIASHTPELLRLRLPTTGPDPSSSSSVVVADDRVVAFEAAARLLNHENILSVLGPLRTGTDDGERWAGLVHELALGGSLDAALAHASSASADGGFLPEGMVWHVALGLLRALAYLHAGGRERVGVRWGEGGEGEGEVRWLGWDEEQEEEDWMPVLHRGVDRPENIWFMGRKGRESYGVVKLGGFERCCVAGEVVRGEADGDVEWACCLEGGDGAQATREEMRGYWREAEEGSLDFRTVEPDGRPYTVGSELHALGEVLYRMMTGRKYPADERCSWRGCDCFHVEPATPCPHRCVYRDVRLDDEFGRGRHKYSDGLVGLLRGLLGMTRAVYVPAKTCYEETWGRYHEWKKGTVEGRAHVDHYDGLLDRKRAAWRREEKRLMDIVKTVQAERRSAGRWTEEELREMVSEDMWAVDEAMEKWQTENAMLLQ